MADINLTAEQVAALILSIGDKSKLKTEEKQTLVDAINNVLDMRVNPQAVPLYIRGTYDAEANTFTPDVDYTLQDILAAVSAGRYVALVVVIGNSTAHYIVPCTDYNSSSVGFSLLLIYDISDITGDYTNIRIYRHSEGWAVGTFQIT